MKICLVGHHVEYPDEGVRNVTSNMYAGLEKKHAVVKVHINRIGEWARVRQHDPQIIHFVLGLSSYKSILVTKALGLLNCRAKTIVSAIQPIFPKYTKWMAWFCPDLILAQSRFSMQMFNDAGCKAVLLQNGIDINRFDSISPKQKANLRKKYGLADDVFLILHVGAINRGRNSQILSSLQGDGRQVILVGRRSEKPDRTILYHMRKSGCIVFDEFIPGIEEIYGLSDCYVFPCFDRRKSIEFPLSVLEAMACNIPVVTSLFGGLPDAFSEDESLRFARNDRELCHKVLVIAEKRPNATTRLQVEKFSWNRVIKRIESVYEELLSDGTPGS